MGRRVVLHRRRWWPHQSSFTVDVRGAGASVGLLATRSSFSFDKAAASTPRTLGSLPCPVASPSACTPGPSHSPSGSKCEGSAACSTWRRVVRAGSRAWTASPMLLSALHQCVCHASSISAQELRRALRLLELSDRCTDAEIKAAFQAFAKANHPDTFSPYTSADAAANAKNAAEAETLRRLDPRTSAAEKMAQGTEAYRLLKRLSYEERQMILAYGSGGASDASGTGQRRRSFYTYDDFGPGGAGRSSFHFTEEEFAKAQAAYAGRPREGSSAASAARRGMRDHTERRQRVRDEEDGFFDPRTAEGRRRTARFNQATSRVEQLRRRAGRDAAPWKVADGDGTYHAPRGGAAGGRAGQKGQENTRAHSFRNLEAFLRSAQQAARRRNNTFSTFHERFSYGPGFSLRFYLSQIRDDLQELRKKYERDRTFAGIHGARYDSPEQEAKIQEELKHHPQLRQYLLLKQRAQEKAVVDQAVGRLLYLALSVVALLLLGLIALALVRKRRATKEYERLKGEREAAGGG